MENSSGCLGDMDLASVDSDTQTPPLRQRFVPHRLSPRVSQVGPTQSPLHSHTNSLVRGSMQAPPGESTSRLEVFKLCLFFGFLEKQGSSLVRFCLCLLQSQPQLRLRRSVKRRSSQQEASFGSF